MYKIDVIIANVMTLAKARNIEVNDIEVGFEAKKAIEFGAMSRNSSVKELLDETKDYTSVLTSMTLSAIQLYDKLGRIADNENGVVRTFEDGSIYQKHDIKFFVPRFRSPR